MKQRFFLTGFLATFLLLTACEKGTDVICKVNNNTGENVTVKAYYKYLTSGVNELKLSPGETKNVFVGGRQVGGFHENTNIENVIDSLVMKTDNGKASIKLFNQSADWNKNVNKKRQTITFTTAISAKDLK